MVKHKKILFEPIMLPITKEIIVKFDSSIYLSIEDILMFSFILKAQFKKMLTQKRREQLKEFEKQERKIRELKAGGKSTKQAVCFTFK